GCQLLSRSSRGVMPTKEGVLFYRHAQSVLQKIEVMKSLSASRGRGLSGRVTVGLPVSVAQTLAMPLISTMIAQYPEITLCLIEYPSSYLAELLLNRRIHLALLFEEDVPRGVQGQPLLNEDLYVIGLPNAGGSCAL